MRAARRFDTPFKRMSFLALIVGVVTLAVSLVVWTLQSGFNKIYYSEDHYLWLPVDLGYSGRVERKWSWDHDCVRPLAQARIDKLKAELEDHRRAHPEKPSDDLIDYRSLLEPQRRTLEELEQSIAKDRRQRAVRNAYLEWSGKESSLKLAVDSATARLTRLNYSGVREGEVFQPNRRFDPWEPLFPKKEDTRTKEEKFVDSLYSQLGLTAFPAFERDRIFEECVRESTVGYKLVDISHHTELDDWPVDHPIPVTLGLLLTAVGFFGSYGHRASSSVIRSTVGRLLSWLKTGEARPGEVSSSNSEKPTTVVSEQAPPVSTGVVDALEDQASKEKSGWARFLPHLLIFGGLFALLVLGVATNDPASARFFGHASAAALDPLNLAIAAILGLSVRRNMVLMPCLIAVGFGLAVVVAQMNASLGARLSPEIIMAKIAAALAVGYLANLIRMFFKKATTQESTRHDNEEPAGN